VWPKVGLQNPEPQTLPRTPQNGYQLLITLILTRQISIYEKSAVYDYWPLNKAKPCGGNGVDDRIARLFRQHAASAAVTKRLSPLMAATARDNNRLLA